MLSAIGSSAFSSPAGAGTSTSGLEAQLIRYQKELSDCVNCDSANTREGRETIQAISNKISAVKARIEGINVTNSIVQPATTNANTTSGITANKDTAASGTPGNTAVAAVSAADSASATVGSRLDVLA